MCLIFVCVCLFVCLKDQSPFHSDGLYNVLAQLLTTSVNFSVILTMNGYRSQDTFKTLVFVEIAKLIKIKKINKNKQKNHKNKKEIEIKETKGKNENKGYFTKKTILSTLTLAAGISAIFFIIYRRKKEESQTQTQQSPQ